MPSKPSNNLYDATIQQVYALRGNTLKQPALGVEVEVEFPRDFTGITGLNGLGNTHWSIKTDGSLRNGLEAVSKPILVGDLEKVLPTLLEILPLDKARTDSPRTSIHVHLNFTGLTLKEVVTFYTHIFLLEDSLLEVCGSSRKGNNFTLASSAALNNFEKVLDCVRNINAIQISEENRYSFCNLASLRRFGTIEIRGMRGLTDIKEIKIWCDLLLEIYFKSIEKVTPTRLLSSPIEELIPKGLLQFVDSGFVIEKLNSNLSLAYEFVNSHPTLWDMTNPLCDPRNDPAWIEWMNKTGNHYFPYQISTHDVQRQIKLNRKDSGLSTFDFNALREEEENRPRGRRAAQLNRGLNDFLVVENPNMVIMDEMVQIQNDPRIRQQVPPQGFRLPPIQWVDLADAAQPDEDIEEVEADDFDEDEENNDL